MRKKILLWWWRLVYREMKMKESELGMRWSGLKIVKLEGSYN